MERKALLEWEKQQSRFQSLALSIASGGTLWAAEREGDAVRVFRPNVGESRTVDAPAVTNPDSHLRQICLLGDELVTGRETGLWVQDRQVVSGQFEAFAAAGQGGEKVIIAVGQPDGEESGVWIMHGLDQETARRRQISDNGYAVAATHTGERVGLAWSDSEGVHTVAVDYAHLDSDAFHNDLISYYAGEDERFEAPSVTVDQTGLPYVLFYVLRKENEQWLPTRELQLNFERISFKASAGDEGLSPKLLIHRRRLYMFYCAKSGATTVRWRVPGTTIWDGATHIPGAYPQATSDGDSLYLATDAGIWSLATGQNDEGSDILHHSWASPDYEAEDDKGVRRLSGRQYSIDAQDLEPKRGLWRRIKGLFGR